MFLVDPDSWREGVFSLGTTTGGGSSTGVMVAFGRRRFVPATGDDDNVGLEDPGFHIAPFATAITVVVVAFLSVVTRSRFSARCYCIHCQGFVLEAGVIRTETSVSKKNDWSAIQ